jgi:hypothetical protein
MRDSFVFYSSWFEAIKQFPPEMQGAIYAHIIEYGLYGKEPNNMGAVENVMWPLIKPQIDANRTRYENGCKGGRRKPSEELTETKTEPNENQTEPNGNQTETKTEPNGNQTEPNDNVNENENENVNGHVNENEKENKETNPIGLAKKGELSLSQAPDLLKNQEGGTQSPNGVAPVAPPKVFDTDRYKREQAIRNREKRMRAFHQTLLPYMPRYGAEMVRAFFDYWSEPNKSGSQMRFELEKTWSVDRRLATWSRNDSKFGNKKSSHYGETKDILYVRSPT